MATNKWGIPQKDIDSLVRYLAPKAIALFSDEENLKQLEVWKQEEKKSESEK